MILDEFRVETEPGADDQLDYVVRVDVAGLPYDEVSGIRWDHNERMVIIEIEVDE